MDKATITHLISRMHQAKQFENCSLARAANTSTEWQFYFEALHTTLVNWILDRHLIER